MEEFLYLWGFFLFGIWFGIWYIKEGYYYGFIKQKYKKSLAHIGDKDEDYYYGDKAKKMGAFQIFIGIVSIVLSIWLLYAYYVLGIVKM